MCLCFPTFELEAILQKFIAIVNVIITFIFYDAGNNDALAMPAII